MKKSHPRKLVLGGKVALRIGREVTELLTKKNR